MRGGSPLDAFLESNISFPFHPPVFIKKKSSSNEKCHISDMFSALFLTVSVLNHLIIKSVAVILTAVDGNAY